MKQVEIFKVEILSEVLDVFDNNKLFDEVMMQQNTRVSDDIANNRYEDTYLEIKENTELYKLGSVIDAMATENNCKLGSMWGHILRPLESTHSHNHTGTYSFIYYVKVPKGPTKSGALVFEWEAGHATTYEPKEGELIVLPSWVRHKVLKNLTNEIRMSISGTFEDK